MIHQANLFSVFSNCSGRASFLHMNFLFFFVVLLTLATAQHPFLAYSFDEADSSPTVIDGSATGAFPGEQIKNALGSPSRVAGEGRFGGGLVSGPNSTGTWSRVELPAGISLLQNFTVLVWLKLNSSNPSCGTDGIKDVRNWFRCGASTTVCTANDTMLITDVSTISLDLDLL